MWGQQKWTLNRHIWTKETMVRYWGVLFCNSMLRISSMKGKKAWRHQHFLKANASPPSFNYNFDTKITTRMLWLTNNWVSIHVSLKRKHWTLFALICWNFSHEKNKKTSPQSIHFNPFQTRVFLMFSTGAKRNQWHKIR